MKALITGASGGIGSAVAELLRQNGYEILTLASRFEDLDALAKECRALAAAQGIENFKRKSRRKRHHHACAFAEFKTQPRPYHRH